MARGPGVRHMIGMAIYGAMSLLVIFFSILPLDHLPDTLPGPDFLLATTVLWVIRRPDLAPVWLVALVFLMADFLLTRPPGLMSAAAILATEYLRTRPGLTHEVSFFMEWAVAASLIASVLVGTATFMVIMATPAPGLGPLLFRLLGTVLAYPLLAGLGALFLGLRRAGGGGFGYGAAR